MRVMSEGEGMFSLAQKYMYVSREGIWSVHNVLQFSKCACVCVVCVYFSQVPWRALIG